MSLLQFFFKLLTQVKSYFMYHFDVKLNKKKK